MTFNVTKNGTLTTNRFEAMRIDNTGYVGIGTTTPGAPLEVNGNIKLTTSSGGKIVFQDGTMQGTAAQVRVVGVCPSGEAVTSVNADGSVNCAETAVQFTSPDSSITIGGTAAAPTIEVNSSTLQKRVNGSCPAGEAVSSVNSDGSVNCVAIGGTASTPQYIALWGEGTGLTTNDSGGTGTVGTSGTALNIDQAIAVTDVTYNVSDPGAPTCSTALVRVTNGTIYEDVPIPTPTSAYDTGAHVLVFPAGSTISVQVAQLASCSGPCESSPPYACPGLPSSIWGSVRYRAATGTDVTTCPANLTLSSGSCVDVAAEGAAAVHSAKQGKL
jgi:hypothetical protein